MPMQFNPHTALLRGMDLGSPTTSQGGINNLLQMQQNTLSGMVDSFGNIGKTSRTNTVNDLIARGGLEGLNEAQTQARIQRDAGGTLTPEGQANVDRLLQTVGKEDQRKFTTQERLGGETFLSGEHEKTALAKLLSEQTEAKAKLTSEETKAKATLDSETIKNALDKELKGMELSQREKDSLRTYKSSMYGHNVTAQGQKQIVQGDDGMQYYADKATGKLIPLVKGVLPEHASGGGSGGTNGKTPDALKLTGRALSFHNELSGKGKDAFKQMYSTGDLQVSPAERIKMPDGTIKEQGYKVLYKGQPMTITEVKQMVERKK